MYKEVEEIVVRGAEIMFPNFSGKEGRYNDAGEKSFCLVIDDPVEASRLSEEGWNIRILKPLEPEDKPKHYLNVAVKFGNYPPKVYLCTETNKVRLDEDTISELDTAEIKNVDVIVRPYTWDPERGKIKAYLKTMYVTIKEDPLAAHYDDLAEQMPWNNR